MVTKLTAKQKKQIIEVRDYWINKVYNCEPTNREAAKELVDYMYAIAGLESPQLIFAESPLSANVIANLMAGNSVWASVRNSVVDSVGDSVGDSVWASVRDSVVDSVGDSVWDSIRDSVWASVGASVRNSIRDSVWASVGDSVGNSVVDSVGDSVGDKYYPSLLYGEVWGQGWQAFYDFFVRKTGLVRHGQFLRYINLVDKANAYWIIPFQKVCIVTLAPKRIYREWNNDRYVMHNDEGQMAIEWGDGWGQYVLHGITLQKETYDKILRRDASFKEVMAVSNMEERMMYLKYLNCDELLKGAEAVRIHTGTKEALHFKYDKASGLSGKITYNELYKIPKESGVFEQDEYFVRYEDPSTGRVYLSCVDPEIGKKGNADEAMAWKLQLTLAEYLSMEAQS